MLDQEKKLAYNIAANILDQVLQAGIDWKEIFEETYGPLKDKSENKSDEEDVNTMEDFRQFEETMEDHMEDILNELQRKW